jgi:hypothetical protein
MRPEVVINRTRPPITRSAPAPSLEPVTVEATPAAAVDNGPTHPYADVPDATYAPPVNRNFAAAPKQAPTKKANPAYKTLPPVYDGKIATDVYDRAMAMQVTLTQRELLSLSPKVRSQVRERSETLDHHPTYLKSPPHKLDTENASRMFQSRIHRQSLHPRVVRHLRKNVYGPLEWLNNTTMTPKPTKHPNVPKLSERCV